MNADLFPFEPFSYYALTHVQTCQLISTHQFSHLSRQVILHGLVVVDSTSFTRRMLKISSFVLCPSHIFIHKNLLVPTLQI